MKRVEIKTTTNANFIGCWQKKSNKICKDIINFYEENSQSSKSGTSGNQVNEEVKLSTDLTINPKDLVDKKYSVFVEYMDFLKKCHEDYLQQWPSLKTMFGKVHCGSFNIQKYNEGGHFKKFHMERTSILNSSRIFAWMTYLNNVEKGGHTDFRYYDISMQPKPGLTMIWPAEWTHAHRGNEVEKGIKYIITGWFHMPDELEYDRANPNYGVPLLRGLK